jgi:hypothetical protein
MYEIGMSYVGLQILYDVINSVDDVACERVFAPDTDMEELMRAESMPLFSLETKREIASFDLLGFTLQYEMSFTNILNMLDLAGLPLAAADRGDDMPVVMAGGPCAYNPEPLAKFFDFFINESIATEGDIQAFPALAHFVKEISCPWLYVDDIIGISLWFLAGAIWFKSGKTAKTILAFIALSMVLSMAITPFMSTYMKEFAMRMTVMDSQEAVERLFNMGIMRHAALVDTINDTVANLIMLGLIYFRIKTIKH